MAYYLEIQSPVGWLRVVEVQAAITELHIMKEPMAVPEQWEQRETPLLLETKRQLSEYFDGLRVVSFSLPLAPRGTVFQQSCLEAVGGDSLRGNPHLWPDCGSFGQADSQQSGRRRQSQQSHCHRHSLPSGYRCQRQADRLCRRFGYQRKAAALGRGAVAKLSTEGGTCHGAKSYPIDAGENRLLDTS